MKPLFVIRWAYGVLGALAFLLWFWSLPLLADNSMSPFVDYRQCNAGGAEVKRDPDGKIARSQAVIAAFKKLHPCPSTHKPYGACPGWNIDHTWPLANGGCDAVYNMNWLPVEIKRCGEWYCKDRWERDVYRPSAEQSATP